MKKVYLTLFAEHIEFDTEEQKSEIQKLKEYIFFSENFTGEDIEELFIKIIKIKGDWISYSLNEDKNNVYADITLTYPYFNGQKETNIPSEIFTILERFVNNKKSFASSDTNDDIENIDKETTGLLVIIEELDILEELQENNIDYEIITKKVSRTEAGAGDIFNEIIIWVASSAAWDIIKAGFERMKPYLRTPQDIEERKAENVNYKKLLKSISLRVNIKPKDLILINMYKKNTETIFEFKGNKSIISVICDENYIIHVFCNRKVQKNAIKNAECCHPYGLLSLRKSVSQPVTFSVK
jgi:hypothetical protein